MAVDPAAGSPTLPASFAHLSDEDTTTTSPTSSEAPAEHHFAVRYPAQDAHVDSKYLVFSGTTSPGSVVSSGEWLAEVSNDGAWSMLLVLSAGANETTFTSRGPGGVSEETVRVHLVSTTAHGSGDGSDTAVGDDDGTHFVAHQQYGSCGEAIPYDVFSGKAEPGSMVHVTSDYGSGSTLADSDGEWRVRVEFPSAPFGESFKVHVTDGAHEQKFAFTRTS